jgi:hypothetical protein
MVEHPMAVLRFITVGDGARCVMTSGISRMLMWYVVSWASLVHPALLLERSTVRGLVLSGWITSSVKEERHCYNGVLIMDGDLRTVFIARM